MGFSTVKKQRFMGKIKKTGVRKCDRKRRYDSERVDTKVHSNWAKKKMCIPIVRVESQVLKLLVRIESQIK